MKVICVKEKLISNINKIHTTDMGYERIKKNLNIDTDIVKYCIGKIIDKNSIVCKEGKNYYCEVENIRITINSSTYTIITAKKN